LGEPEGNRNHVDKHHPAARDGISVTKRAGGGLTAGGRLCSPELVMSRWLRRLAALTAALALLAAPVGVCTCRAEAMASAPEGHDCCAPKAGLRAAPAACCAADQAPASGLVTTDPGAALVAPTLASLPVAARPALDRSETLPRCPRAAASLPAAVLRI